MPSAPLPMFREKWNVVFNTKNELKDVNMTDNATKQANHRTARKALLLRCVLKEFTDGKAPCTLISEADMERARLDFVEVEAARKYKEAMNNVKSKVNEHIPSRYKKFFKVSGMLSTRIYVASPHLTPERALEALCETSYKEYPDWVSSYLHENLKRLKRLRNRPHVTRGTMEEWVLKEVNRHVHPSIANSVAKKIIRWIYPNPNERDYFYPTTYSELRRGRTTTYLAGGGKLYPNEYIDIIGRHPSEIPETEKLNIIIE